MSPENPTNPQDESSTSDMRLRLTAYQRFGQIPKEDIERITNETITPLAQKFLDFFKNPELVNEALALGKKYYEQQGITPLSSFLAASLVGDASWHILYTTREGFNSSIKTGNPMLFKYCAIFDFWVGVVFVTEAITRPACAIQGNLDAILRRAVNAADEPPSDLAEQFLHARAKAIKDSQVLQEHPDANSLINQVMLTYEQGAGELPECVNRQFALQGSKAAKEAYGKTYPLAEIVNKRQI